MKEKVSEMFKFGWAYLDAPLFSSLFVILIVLIISLAIGAKARKAVKEGGYKKAPKGLLFWGDAYCSYVTNFTVSNMGRSSEVWSGYFFVLFAYLFLAFNASLLGIPSVIDWIPAPLCLSIMMFTVIQVVAIKYQKWSYFHRYIEPIVPFLPINLITMWSPIISTCMRMFGNCLAGSVLIGMIQWAISKFSMTAVTAMNLSLSIGGIPANWSSFFNSFPYWTGTLLSPLPIGVLNIYFSLFSGFVQTLVFASLSALWIAQEKPSDEDQAYLEFQRVPASLSPEQINSLIPQEEKVYE